MYKRQPIRDPFLETIEETFKMAHVSNSVSKFIDALKLTFHTLELMKLDIANHELKLLRPTLLENTIEFEKQYFTVLFENEDPHLTSSLAWFQDAILKLDPPVKITFGNIRAKFIYRAFIRCTINLLSCCQIVEKFPGALYFDHSRLMSLRVDVRPVSYTHLDVYKRQVYNT